MRATDDVCVYRKHPLFEGDQRRMLPEVLKSSCCGRFSGRWDDDATDAGAVWAAIQKAAKEGEAPPAPPASGGGRRRARPRPRLRPGHPTPSLP